MAERPAPRYGTSSWEVITLVRTAARGRRHLLGGQPHEARGPRRPRRRSPVRAERKESDELIITLNTTAPPFDRPVARQAVAAALDGEAIAAANGSAFPAAWGPVTSSSPAYLSPADAGYALPDPARARELATAYETVPGGTEQAVAGVCTTPSLTATWLGPPG
jgi:hypothetical protein